MIISFLGIHKYQTHPGFWHQYSYAKQTTKVWKTCSKLNFLKGFCECEQKKDVNSIFWEHFFLHLHSLCGITYFEPNCRMRWIFMDFITNFFLLFFTVSNTSVQNFKKNISDWNKLLKSWKVSKFIISCLGIHEYPCHPEFWFQYSSVK